MRDSVYRDSRTKGGEMSEVLIWALYYLKDFGVTVLIVGCVIALGYFVLTKGIDKLVDWIIFPK